MLLPEQFDWAGGSRAEKLANAERLPGGPAYAMAQGQALKHRIFVHAGSIMEKIDGEERYPQHVASSLIARARRSPAIARSTCST